MECMNQYIISIVIILKKLKPIYIDILLDKYINNKEYQILEMFKFSKPDEIEQYNEGFNIQMIPTNI
jgi:hypothetical protein